MTRRLAAALFLISVLAPPPASAHEDHERVYPADAPRQQLAVAGDRGDIAVARSGDYLIITADGLPSHATGRFPNRRDPNPISAQDYHFRVSSHPTATGRPRPIQGYLFGVALNGVVFDPGTDEYWQGLRGSPWRYAALTGFMDLGQDANNAHTQPGGAYHYHGIPVGLLQEKRRPGSPTLLGYAADGFPIYGPEGYAGAGGSAGGLKSLSSSYRIRSGTRPSGPGGAYDGRFDADWEFVAGLGDLDACNGRFGAMPDYPAGTYHYVVTANYPFVPRCFAGTPDSSFAHGPGAPGGARGTGGGPPRRPPPR
jgi:hypothetical protein